MIFGCMFPVQKNQELNEGVAMLELSPDPWLWPDFDAAQIVELSEISKGNKPEDPLFQYFAVKRCNALKPEVDAGSGFAVLAAVRICGTHGLVMPLWLVYAFNRRYDAVNSFKALSWDDPESFGRPYPKGTNKSAKKKALSLRFAVYNAINAIKRSEEETAIDKALFERVGLQFNLGSTLAEEYYYEAKKIAFPFNIEFKKNTAKSRKLAGIRKTRP